MIDLIKINSSNQDIIIDDKVYTLRDFLLKLNLELLDSKCLGCKTNLQDKKNNIYISFKEKEIFIYEAYLCDTCVNKKIDIEYKYNVYSEKEYKRYLNLRTIL